MRIKIHILILTLFEKSSSTSFELSFSESFIYPDQTIRLFSEKSTHCAFKKYSGYNTGDEIWLKSCDIGNQNPIKSGKYKWGYNKTTNQIYSVGNSNFCWNVWM